MGKPLIKFDKDEPEILKRFYERLRTTLTEAYHYKPEEADFEAYRWILQNTSKPPKDYLKIFFCVPEGARKAILRHLGYKSETAFKKSFSKQLNVYRQSIFRREEKENAWE
jgi:hypothetical protein